jgi:hypothetical protein
MIHDPWLLVLAVLWQSLQTLPRLLSGNSISHPTWSTTQGTSQRLDICLPKNPKQPQHYITVLPFIHLIEAHRGQGQGRDAPILLSIAAMLRLFTDLPILTAHCGLIA